MKTNIALIGFMGVGKTSVGKALSEKLNMTLLELDSLIEKKAGKSILEIFQQEGETYFREIEMVITQEAAKKDNMIIACGGGVVLNKINIDRLKEKSVIVYLSASINQILKRLKTSENTRPLLINKSHAEIARLLALRRPLYKQYADFEINTSNKNINVIVENIIKRLEEYEDFHFQEHRQG